MRANPTLTGITVDGDFTDWQRVFANRAQVTWDSDGSAYGSDCIGSLDRDCLIGSTGRDIYRFAWTYDQAALYLFTERVDEGNNAHQYFFFFMDLDNDAKMQATDRVLRASWSPNNPIETTLFPYVPVDPAGDPMVNADGWADGYGMPGQFNSSLPLWTASQAGQSGLSFEVAVPWAALGVAPATPIKFHVSAANTAANLGGVDDNCGGPDGRLGTFGYFGVEVRPDRIGGSLSPGSVDYAHEIVNEGNDTDVFPLWTVSSIGLRTELYADTDGDGYADDLMAVDANGNGSYGDPGDQVLWDEDQDGMPDTGRLAGGQVFSIVLRVVVPSGMDGLVDETELFARSAAMPSAHDSAVDTTGIGLLVIVPSGERSGLPGATVRHETLLLNNAEDVEAGEIDLTGALGWNASLWRDDDGDGTPDVLLTDTDGDGSIDTGALAGLSRTNLVVSVDIPGNAATGTREVTDAKVTADAEPTSPFTAHFGTTAADAAEIRPSYTFADLTNFTANPGDIVYFPQVLYNNQSTADCFDIAASSSRGYTVHVWSDPDGDGYISDGSIITSTCGSAPLGPFGGAFPIVVEVVVPASASIGTQDTTTVTATSTADASVTASATDETRVGHLIVYDDPGRTHQSRAFATCETAYLQVGALPPATFGAYAFEWVDTLGNVQRTQSIITDGRGLAVDQYTFGASDALGIWEVRLVETTTGHVIETLPIRHERSGEVASLEPARPQYGVGDVVTIGAVLRNTNVWAPFADTALEMTIVTADGSRYVASDGTLQPYTGSEYTRRVVSIDVESGQWTSQGASVRLVDVGDLPIGSILTVHALWTTRCGAPIATGTTSFELALPAPVILFPQAGSFTNQTSLTAYGTGLPQAQLELTLDGASTLGTAVAGDGTWSVALPELAEGVHHLVALQRADGWSSNVSPVVRFTVDVTPPLAPVILEPADGAYLADTQVVLSGTAEPLGVVEIREGGLVVAQAPVQPDGSWDTTLVFAEGTHLLEARTIDRAGNVSEPAGVGFVVDVTAPLAPVFVSPTDGSWSNTGTVVFSGNAEAGSTVTIADGTGATWVVVTAADDGTFSTTLPVADGTFVVHATSTDTAGNTSDPSADVSFGVDTLAPEAPQIVTPTNGNACASPQVWIEGLAEVGAVVTVYEAGVVVAEATADVTGRWTAWPVFADGTHTIDATASDAAGNVSPRTPTVTFLVDTIAPLAPTIATPKEGALLATGTVLVSGTAEAASTVSVYDGTVLVGTVVAAADGGWSLTVLAADGVHTVSAEAADVVVNVSPRSPDRTFVVDTTAPVMAVILTPEEGALVGTSDVTLTGTGEAGSFVDLIEQGTSVVGAQVAADGTWHVTARLADGLHQMEAQSIDLAGNRGVRSPTRSFFVDTAAPNAPIIRTPADGTLTNRTEHTVTGDAESLGRVEIFLDGASIGVLAADASGAFSLPVTLEEGAHTFTAQVTDATGHVSPASDAVGITVDLTPPAAPVFETPADGSTTDSSTVMARGTTEAGAVVTVYLDGNLFTMTLADAQGGFSVSLWGLERGEHVLTARALDGAGNDSGLGPETTFTVSYQDAADGGNDGPPPEDTNLATTGAATGCGCSAQGGGSAPLVGLLLIGVLATLRPRRPREEQ